MHQCEVVSADEGDVRLAQGMASTDGSAEYGRLEVFHDGGWGTVCADDFLSPDFGAESVSVACRQLGFQMGVQIPMVVCEYGSI